MSFDWRLTNRGRLLGRFNFNLLRMLDSFVGLVNFLLIRKFFRILKYSASLFDYASILNLNVLIDSALALEFGLFGQV